MRHRFSSYGISLFVTFGTFLFLPLESSFAFPAGSNGWHLNSPFQAKSNADVVCKVQVLSIRQEAVIKSNLFPGAQNVSRMIATSKVLSVIKGKCPEVIDIEFHYSKDRDLKLGHPLWQLYTELSEGEVCIVFLKESEPCYKLGRIRSKARVQPKAVDYNLGDTPNLRLLAEFLASCNSKDEMVRLQAVEELGYLGKAMIDGLRPFKGTRELFQKNAMGLGKAKQALRKTRSCEDIVIRNVSIISTFQVDDSPGIEAPLRLLRLNPAEFDPNDSRKKYGIRDFSISNVQLRLLETMDATTRRAVVNLKDGSVIRRKDRRPGIFRGVRGFDYAAFYKQALDCEVVKNTEAMRGAIANVIWIRYEERSVPEMVRLLDDPSLYVRFVAVGSLMKYTGEGPERCGWQEFGDKEREYIQYWKKWWKDNRNHFESQRSSEQ